MNRRLNKYYYDIDIRLIDNENNKIIDINKNFTNLGILFDFKKHVFPVIEVQLSLDTYLYNLIRTSDCNIRLSILKKELDTLNDYSNLVTSSLYMNNEIFTIIDKTKLVYINDEQEHDIPSLNVTLTLFSMNHLKINKFMFNSNYLNCRPVDIVSLINNINQAKILIERPINQRKYEQIIIPPMNIIEMINYIQNNYSLYKDDLLLFFDFNTYYVMNKVITGSTPKEKLDYKNVIFDIVNEDDRLIPFNCGYRSMESDFYYVKANNNDLKILDNTETKSEIFGTNNIIFDVDDDLNTIRNDKRFKDNPEKVKLYYNNKNLLSVENDINNVYKRKALFRFSNLDIETFKCNKIFKCTFNNKKFDFRIEKLIFNFLKDKTDGNIFSTGTCQFIEN